MSKAGIITKVDVDDAGNPLELSDQERAMFEFYKANPDLACMDLLNQDLPAFQRVVIKGIASHSYVMSVLSRGSGKTRMIGMNAAILAMFNRNMNIGFLSPVFRNSKQSFMEFENLVNESGHLQASIKKISKQTDMWVAEFWNGSKIVALPLAADNPMSIRGTRLHVAMIDEFPHVLEQVIDRVIQPMLATMRNPMENVRRIEREKKMIAEGVMQHQTVQMKNKICGFSSAYFKFNHMYKRICDFKALAAKQKAETGKTDYAVYTFNYLDGPEGFFDMGQIQHARETSSELAFRMEYMSEFPDDSEGFFKRSLLDSCVSHPPHGFELEFKGDEDGFYIMGIDPARNQDTFGVSIIKVLGDEMRLIRVINYDKRPFPEIARDLRVLIKEFNIKLIGMDAGGGGLSMRDILEDPISAGNEQNIILDMEDEGTVGRKGRRILRMIDFSPSWIASANFDMRSSLEHRKLLFPSILQSSTYLPPKHDINANIDVLFEETTKEINDPKEVMAEVYFTAMKQIESIMVSETKTGVLHFDTPHNRMKKDLYTSILIAHRIAADHVRSGYQQKELACGGFIGPDGKILGPDSDYYDQIDLERSYAPNRVKVEDAALIS